MDIDINRRTNAAVDCCDLPFKLCEQALPDRQTVLALRRRPGAVSSRPQLGVLGGRGLSTKRWLRDRETPVAPRLQHFVRNPVLVQIDDRHRLHLIEGGFDDFGNLQERQTACEKCI